jgi:hypothetical protein
VLAVKRFDFGIEIDPKAPTFVIEFYRWPILAARVRLYGDGRWACLFAFSFEGLGPQLNQFCVTRHVKSGVLPNYHARALR